MIKISEFCKTASGGTPLKSNKSFYEGGDVPWLLSGEVGNRDIFETKNFITKAGLDGSSAKIFPANTVVIAMYGATAGEVGMLRCEAATNQAVCGVYPNENILPEYLYYFFLNHKEILVSQAVGNAQPNISQQKIKNTAIFLPPIPEQKRIVAILDQAFAQIEQARAKTEQNLKNARELFESYLQQVFSQRGEGWVETNLGKEVELTTGFAFKSKDYVTHANSIHLIRGDNVVQGNLRWDGVKRWPNDKFEGYEKYLLAKNDIVLAMDRTWVKAGMKYAKISNLDLPAFLVQRVARLRCLNSLDPDYLYYLIGSKLFEKYVLSIQTGLGVPHISGKQIQSFNFARPDIDQQQSALRTINQLAQKASRLTEIYQRKLEDLDQLQNSVLQKAFSGELTNKDAEGAVA